METPRQLWERFVENPDWDAASRISGYFLPTWFAPIIGLILALPFSTGKGVLTGVLIVVITAGVLLLQYRMRKRMNFPNQFAIPAVSFPPPPSSDWPRAQKRYVRSVLWEFKQCAILSAFTITFTAGFAAVFAFGEAPGLPSMIIAGVTFTISTALLLVAFQRFMRPTLARMAADYWQECKDAVVSPIHSKAANLRLLVEEMQERSESAESLVMEVEKLSRELNEELESRQREETRLLQSLDTTKAAADQPSEVVDALFEQWTRRQDVQRKIDTRKDRAFDVAMMVIGAFVGAIIGYVLGVALPWSTLSNLVR